MKSLVESAVTDWGNKGTINLNDELRKLTLTIAVQIFLGSEKTDEIDRVCGWFDTLMAKERVAIVQWDVPFTARGQGQTARRKLMEYVRQTI